MAFALLVLCAAARPPGAGGQAPVFHGVLDVRPVRGRIDPGTGIARLNVRGWLFLTEPGSNGIFPEHEDVLVALGDENTFTIPAGELDASASGRRFSYRAKLASGARGIRSLQLVRRPDTWYKVRFQLQGLDLPALLTQDPVCMPMALIVGDDDGFTGIDLTRRSFTTSRLRVKGACQSDTEWPWL